MPSPRDRGGMRPGQKWVEANYVAKEKAKESNGGILPCSPALETTDYPGKEEWSIDNLPIVLFYLFPPPSKFAGKTPRDLIEGGEPVISSSGHKMRYFETLPRYISVDVEGWLIEAWRRIDPRITYTDIIDRMREDDDFADGMGLKKPNNNSLQNHCRRDCRRLLNHWVEYGRRDEPHRADVESIEKLSYENIVFNTVLNKCDIAPHRLVKLALKRKSEDGAYEAVELKVTHENYLETTLPIDHFLQDALTCDGQPGVVIESMVAAWEVVLILQERAEKHGLSRWSKLDKKCLPSSWYDRTKDKSPQKENYDGGCEDCTWTKEKDREHVLLMNEIIDRKGVIIKRERASSLTDSDRSPKRQAASFVKSEPEDEEEKLQSPGKSVQRVSVVHRIKYLEEDEEDEDEESYDEELEYETDDSESEEEVDAQDAEQNELSVADDKNEDVLGLSWMPQGALGSSAVLPLTELPAYMNLGHDSSLFDNSSGEQSIFPIGPSYEQFQDFIEKGELADAAEPSQAQLQTMLLNQITADTDIAQSQPLLIEDAFDDAFAPMEWSTQEMTTDSNDMFVESAAAWTEAFSAPVKEDFLEIAAWAEGDSDMPVDPTLTIDQW